MENVVSFLHKFFNENKTHEECVIFNFWNWILIVFFTVLNNTQSQMAELVERVLPDLKFVGSIPAKVQFWLNVKYLVYLSEYSWLMIKDLHTG